MAKKVNGYVKLQVPAGAANPAPPIGPALGQQGVNIMEFCKQFNAQTQKLEKGLPIPVIITVYCGSQLHFHHEDAAGVGADPQGDRHREGQRHAQHRQGGQDHAQAARRDREDEAAGPHGRRSRRRRAHHRGQRPQHGRRRGGV